MKTLAVILITLTTTSAFASQSKCSIDTTSLHYQETDGRFRFETKVSKQKGYSLSPSADAVPFKVEAQYLFVEKVGGKKQMLILEISQGGKTILSAESPVSESIKKVFQERQALQKLFNSMPDCDEAVREMDSGIFCNIQNWDEHQERPFSRLVRKVLREKGYRISHQESSTFLRAGEICTSEGAGNQCTLTIYTNTQENYRQLSRAKHLEGLTTIEYFQQMLKKKSDYSKIKSCSELSL